MRRVAIVSLLVARAAVADQGAIPLDVPLGKTIEVNVNYARGWMCDDPTLIDATLVTRDDRNWWRVTGKKLGTTMCRVGTGLYEVPSYVFEVRVIAKKK